MRPNASGITSANTSHTIGSSNVRRIFATRSSVDSITCDIIRRRSKTYSLPFFDFNVELLMRAYIACLDKSEDRHPGMSLIACRHRPLPLLLESSTNCKRLHELGSNEWRCRARFCQLDDAPPSGCD